MNYKKRTKYEKSWWQSISTWSNLSGCEQYESNQIGLVWCTLWAIVTGCFINNLRFLSYTNYENIKVLFHPVKCFASGYPSQNWAMYTPNKRWWMRDQVWIHTDNKCEVFFFLLVVLLPNFFCWHLCLVFISSNMSQNSFEKK